MSKWVSDQLGKTCIYIHINIYNIYIYTLYTYIYYINIHKDGIQACSGPGPEDPRQLTDQQGPIK